MLVRNEQEGKDYLYNLIDTPGILLLFLLLFRSCWFQLRSLSFLICLPRRTASCGRLSRRSGPNPCQLSHCKRECIFFYFPLLLNIIAFGCGSRHYQNWSFHLQCGSMQGTVEDHLWLSRSWYSHVLCQETACKCSALFSWWVGHSRDLSAHLRHNHVAFGQCRETSKRPNIW